MKDDFNYFCFPVRKFMKKYCLLNGIILQYCCNRKVCMWDMQTLLKIWSGVRISTSFSSFTSERTLFRSDFCLYKNQSHAPSFLLFRKKSRSVFLLACKRTRLRKTVATNFLRVYACGRKDIYIIQLIHVGTSGKSLVPIFL